MSIREQLDAVAAFSHLTAEDRDAVASCASTVSYPADTRIFSAGDDGMTLYGVVSGCVLIQQASSYGPITIVRVAKGHLFGELPFVDGKPRNGDAIVEGDTELLVVDGAQLRQLTLKSRRFRLAILWTIWRSLSEKLRQANDLLTRFFGEPGGDGEAAPRGPLKRPGENVEIELSVKRDLFREQGLSELEVNFLASLSQEERFANGETIFREDDSGEKMYVILEGEVMISKSIPGAGQEALAFLSRGDYFGEIAIMDKGPRSATATAHADGTVVLGLTREVVEGLLDINRVSAERLLKTLSLLAATRLREIDEKILGWYLLAGGPQQ